MAPAPLTFLFRLYQLLSYVAAPLALRAAKKRFDARNGPKERFAERSGHATLPRPCGKLIWMHAVSVGEFLSVLDLVRDLREAGHQILVTTTTSSAAELAQKRLPEGVVHQFAPLDTPQAVGRFVNHWHPELVVFVESEIWPNQIVMAWERGIPLALINARLSDKSLQSWEKRPKTAAALLSRFDRVMTQTNETAEALRRLGAVAERVETTGDMKAAAAALPFDSQVANLLRDQIADRPFWVASSTHDGEEEEVSAAHRLVTEHSPEALLVLVPRHPERGNEVENLLRSEGWTVSRRSRGETIQPKTQVYLADTLGETGLWYHLAPIVFVGGTFVPVGGHNPYEPAHFGCAILHGPLFANFNLAYHAMSAADACLEVEDAAALGHTVSELFSTSRLQGLQNNAKTFIEKAGNNRSHVSDSLLALIR